MSEPARARSDGDAARRDDWAGLASEATLTAEASPSVVFAAAGTRPGPTSALAGTMVAHFQVLELLGAGGFGEVYRARDTRLGRMVALKVLPPAFALDPERRERFRREAIAASALNHPNICTVHDLVEVPGHTLIVMELVEGETLQAAVTRGPFTVADALPVARQIATALGEAHRAGILHRDVKCGNIALTDRGEVKILDFGLAKLVGPEREEESGSTLEKLTAEGTSPGTPGYMSPEQLLGKPLDPRSDLFSLGVVLYRMVTGRLPFTGGSKIAMADAILHAEPRDFGDRDVPGKLKAIIRRLLEKEPEKRYSCAEEVLAELKGLEASLVPGRPTGLSRIARLALVASGAVIVAGVSWQWYRWSRERWALRTTSEIERLVDEKECAKAGALIREVRPVLPTNPALERLWTKTTGEVSVDSVPQGADVAIRPYKGDPDAWEHLGATPLKKLRVVQDDYVWRISKAGFAEVRIIMDAGLEWTVTLTPGKDVPAGMVPVEGGPVRLGAALADAPVVKLAGFLVDRTEVTNEEYQRFVDAGGYRNRSFWKQPFLDDGREVPWEEGIARLVDAAGRPGPATWEVGTYRKGLGKHPVAGVSWYEAAAYAEFAGRSLPTVYHWKQAAQPYAAELAAPGSNFSGSGTQPVGGRGTLSGFGTTDMAGNVKEWCWNESTGGKRYLLGGGFGEPPYEFVQKDHQSPWRRGPNYGFRCAKLLGPPEPAAAARLDRTVRDYAEKPVPDEVFRAFKGLYAYDRGELHPKVEAGRTAEDWVWETVTVDAAYGGERLTIHLFLPRSTPPPFQPVVYFPQANALYEPRFDPAAIEDYPDRTFLPKSGRALVWPVYKGTYEKKAGLRVGGPSANPPAVWRDHVIAWAKDAGRTLDYLETRRDVDARKVGYFGFSLGGAVAPILLAVEERFGVAVLIAGGLHSGKPLPEVDPVNFLGRVGTPTLMVNGRYDTAFPLEALQAPLFRLLGTPAKDKRHLLLESGHAPSPWKDVVGATLDWLDRYLGPVKR